MNALLRWLKSWTSSRQAFVPTSPAVVSTGEGIDCMVIAPENLAAHLQRVAERTPRCSSELPLSPAAKELLNRAVPPHTLDADGSYAIPRSFGVYEVKEAARRFHFGNHPIRHQELAREYGDCRLVATFLLRDEAEQLSFLLNEEG